MNKEKFSFKPLLIIMALCMGTTTASALYYPMSTTPGGLYYGSNGPYGWGGDNKFFPIAIENSTSAPIRMKVISHSCSDGTEARFNNYTWGPKGALLPNRYWSAKLGFQTNGDCGVGTGPTLGLAFYIKDPEGTTLIPGVPSPDNRYTQIGAGTFSSFQFTNAQGNGISAYTIAFNLSWINPNYSIGPDPKNPNNPGIIQIS